MATKSKRPHVKRPRDPNQLAKLIVDMATGNESPDITVDGKNPAAVALGRKGGLVGGKARAAVLSDRRRSEIARQAAKERWGKGNVKRNRDK